VGQPDRAETLKVLTDLEHYTVTHFAAEEEFMRATEYPHLARHKEAHQVFILRIARERAEILDGGHLTLDIVEFLRDWLVNHILVADKAYAKHYRRASNAKSLLTRLFQRFA
jgi:hemerythrin-like metal-binding protein